LLAACKWHEAVLVTRFNLQPPNSGGKDIADAGDLLALLTFNIAYETGVFSGERHRIQLSGCYLALALTGARPAQLVDGEKKRMGVGRSSSAHETTVPPAMTKLDDSSRMLEDILSQETVSRGRPKALCYEDTLPMVMRHPETGEDVLAMSIELIHHKGADAIGDPRSFLNLNLP
jgi:hypothetical protein